MPDSLTNLENAKLSDALARVGQNEQLREIIFEILRRAETQADIVDTFRHEVRLPIIRWSASSWVSPAPPNPAAAPVRLPDPPR